MVCFLVTALEERKKEDSVPEKFQICPNLFQARGASAPRPPRLLRLCPIIDVSIEYKRRFCSIPHDLKIRAGICKIGDEAKACNQSKGGFIQNANAVCGVGLNKTN